MLKKLFFVVLLSVGMGSLFAGTNEFSSKLIEDDVKHVYDGWEVGVSNSDYYIFSLDIDLTNGRNTLNYCYQYN